MEPERNIEKLLRTFAKKRRDQAGEPLGLHPANRRRLQGEVRKQFRRDEDYGILRLFRIQPALFGIVVIAMVAVLAAMLLPALSKAKSKARLAGQRLAKVESAEKPSAPAAVAPVQMQRAPQPLSAPVPAELKSEELALATDRWAINMAEDGLFTNTVTMAPKRRGNADMVSAPALMNSPGSAGERSITTGAVAVGLAKTREGKSDLGLESGIVADRADGKAEAETPFYAAAFSGGTVFATNGLLFDAVALDSSGSHVQLTDKAGHVFDGYLQANSPKSKSAAEPVNAAASSQSYVSRAIADSNDAFGYFWSDRDATNRIPSGNPLLAGRFLFTNGSAFLRQTNGVYLTNVSPGFARDFYLLPFSDSAIGSIGTVETGKLFRIRIEPAPGSAK